MKKLFHISHTDLDGYGCHFISNYFLNTIFDKIEFINVDYQYVDEVVISTANSLNENDTLVITDLNLTLETATNLNSIQKDKGFDLFLVDHHITGKDCTIFNWYLLDDSNSATMNFYKFVLNGNLGVCKYTNSTIEGIIDLIDTYDMWKKDDRVKFNRSSYLSNIIFDNSILDKEIRRKYNIFMIENIGKELLSNTTKYVESIYSDYFDKFLEHIEFETLKDENIPTSIKMALTTIPVIESYINIVKDNVIVFTNISSKISQYCFDYLFENDYTLTFENQPLKIRDFTLVNYNTKRGSISVRSINNTAKDTAIKLGGGGHPNAAGAFISPDDGGLDRLEELL